MYLSSDSSSYDHLPDVFEIETNFNNTYNTII